MDDNRHPQDRGERPGIVPEFMEFLGQNKRWWLLPVLVLVVGLAVLALLGRAS